MKQKLLLSLTFLLLAASLLVLTMPAAATPVQPQVAYQTPTAGPDGRILYRVKEGDTCISISLLNKIDLEMLRRLNNIQGADCPLRTGQDLLLGIVEAPAAPQVTPSPTSLLPAGTPFSGTGQICTYLFNDINGNAIAEDGETAIAGGAVSINDRVGKVSLTGVTTNAIEPLCFVDIPAGDYTISMAAPDGYNATSALTYTLPLKAGDSATLDFGAQLSSAAQPLPVSEGGRSPMLGIVGGLLLLGGIGLGVYMRSMRR